MLVVSDKSSTFLHHNNCLKLESFQNKPSWFFFAQWKTELKRLLENMLWHRNLSLNFRILQKVGDSINVKFIINFYGRKIHFMKNKE